MTGQELEKEKNERRLNERTPGVDVVDAPETPRARARKPDLLWEAVLETCGISGPIPSSARGAYNRAVADLRAVDATPEEVASRGAMFRARWPGASLTPPALARHWAECKPDPRNLPTRSNEAFGAYARMIAADIARHGEGELER